MHKRYNQIVGVKRSSSARHISKTGARVYEGDAHGEAWAHADTKTLQVPPAGSSTHALQIGYPLEASLWTRVPAAIGRHQDIPYLTIILVNMKLSHMLLWGALVSLLLAMAMAEQG